MRSSAVLELNDSRNFILSFVKYLYLISQLLELPWKIKVANTTGFHKPVDTL